MTHQSKLRAHVQECRYCLDDYCTTGLAMAINAAAELGVERLEDVEEPTHSWDKMTRMYR